MSPTRTSLWVWGVLVVATAVAFSPALRHALDGGDVSAPLGRLLAGGWPATRNLTVREARLQCDYAVVEGRTAYAPLVTAGAESGVARVVVSLSRDRLDADCGRAEFRGVVRDLWWEGLSADERHALTAAGARLAEPVRLLDVDQPVDLVVWLAVVGFAAVFGGVFSLIVWLNQRRRMRAGR
jgi:hypothetical protein